MKTIKQYIKRGLQHVAARLGPHQWKCASPRLLVLMYHRVLPEGDPRLATEEPGMYVTPETFRNHLIYLSQLFEFISLSEWIKLKNSGGPLPARACAITFDDGWADNYQFAFPILTEQQVPATIFLVSDLIGTTQTFWPERLARLIQVLAADNGEIAKAEHSWLQPLIDGAELPTHPSAEAVAGIIDRAKALADRQLLSLLDDSEAALGIAGQPQDPALLDWTQIGTMLESGLVEVGSHTRRHTRLANSCDAGCLEDEIVASKRVIETHSRHPISLFCYPNGDYSPAALDMVRQHYSGAVTTCNGWNSAADESHLLRRIGLHEDASKDRTAFLARISGWL